MRLKRSEQYKHIPLDWITHNELKGIAKSHGFVSIEQPCWRSYHCLLSTLLKSFRAAPRCNL